MSIIDVSESYRQQNANSLRQIAYHESGHAAVARHFGCIAAFEIRCITEPKDGGIWRRWAGKCLAVNLEPHMRKPVGLAGKVAEVILTDGNVAGLFDEIRRGTVTLSDEDARMAGAFTRVDIEACAVILRQCWPSVVRIAEGAIADSAKQWLSVDETVRMMSRAP